jgi:hypothetical protein
MSALAHVITFRSARFDIAGERPNPINPIAGESVLRWLREKLSESRYETTEPDAEDWGWYIDVKVDGAVYLVGASGEADDDAPGRVDWTIQIDRHRSLKDKLTGSNKLAADDRVSAVIERLVRQDADAVEIEVSRDA